MRTSLPSLLMLVFAGLAAAAERPLDAAGDPLPSGARARLGTVRLRHAGLVSAVAFAPDGTLLLSGGGPGGDAVQLSDAVTGARRLRLPDDQPVLAVAFAPDGSRFAASFGRLGQRSNLYVRVWETATGKELYRLDTPDDVVRGLAFAPDGRSLLLSGSKYVRLWQLEQQTRRYFEGNEALSGACAFSPDGKTVAAASIWICVWDVESGRCLHRLRGHEDSVYALVFSPDGKTLASGSWGDYSSVRLWDVAAGKERRPLPGRKGDAHAVWFSADGALLRAADRNGLVRAWQLPSGKAVEAPQLQGVVPVSEAVALSPDGRRLAMGCGLDHVPPHKAVRVWDLTNGRQLVPCPGHQVEVRALAFAADGRRLLSGGADGVLLWDVTGRRLLRRLGDECTDCTALAFHPDGTLAACGTQQAGVLLLETVNGGRRLQLIPRHKEPPEESCQPVFHPDVPPPLLQVLFSADGRRLAARSREGVFAWAFAAWYRPAKDWSRLEERGGARVLGPFDNGRLTVAYDGWGVRWEVRSDQGRSRTGRFADLEAALGSPVAAAAVSPDGRLLAAGSDRGALAVWELATGEVVLRLRARGNDADGVRGVAFAASGRLLAAGRADGGVRVWSCASGRELARRDGHTGPVSALAFSPDGGVLASGGADTTVLLWDVADLDRPDRGTERLQAEELEKRWRLLAGADAVAAHRAAAELAADPDRALPFLGERLKAADTGEPAVERLIADLDSDDFDVRERATAALKQHPRVAEPALRRALGREPSLELRRRIEELLDGPPAPLTGEALRTVRAVAVPEQAGTPAARRLLGELAEGAKSRQVRDEARSALERLERTTP